MTTELTRCTRRLAAALIASALSVGCGSTPTHDTSDKSSSADDDSDGEQSNPSSSSSSSRPNSTSGKTTDAGGSEIKRDAGTTDAGHNTSANPKADAATSAQPVATGGLPCDVKKIVTDRCGTCHGAAPVGGAPMSLTSAADFQAAGATDETKKVYELVKTRVNTKTKPMPPPSVTGLSPDELAKLNAWLDKSAPSSEETCSGSDGLSGDGSLSANPDAIDVSGLECYKMLAHAEGDKNSKFSVGNAVDAYWNFGFQAPWQGTLYAKVVRPVIDNHQVLHHWLMYKEPVEDGSIAATIGQHSAGELVFGWAPGGIAADVRKNGDDVAFEMTPTTYSIEVHYNSKDANAMDASGVEVCGTRSEPKNIATLSWLGYDQGGTVAYATGICLDPELEWQGTCVPQSQEPIHILYVSPHLHQTGRHLKSIINSPSGSRVLHDADFDFNYQISYEVNEVLMPGETITTTCTYSAPNCAGQATSQEMCYLFTYAYPKYALADNGPEGSFMHGKGVCLGQ